jgi:hypothetical protein
MPRPKFRGLVWSPEDEATFAKWRRVVLAFYGCVGLLLLGAWLVHRLVIDPRQDATSAANVPAAPAAHMVPASARR